MLTNEHSIFICIVVGFIPYFVKKKRTTGGYALEIRALFWSVQWTNFQLTVHVPLIERLQRIIWVVITHLHEDDDNHMQE